MAFGSGQSSGPKPPVGAKPTQLPGGKGAVYTQQPPQTLPPPGQSSVPPMGGKGTTTATAGDPGMPLQQRYGQPPQALPVQGKGAVGQVPPYAMPNTQAFLNQQPQIQQPYGGFPQTQLSGLGIAPTSGFNNPNEAKINELQGQMNAYRDSMPAYQQAMALQSNFNGQPSPDQLKQMEDLSLQMRSDPRLLDYQKQLQGFYPTPSNSPSSFVQESNMYRPPIANPQVLPANPQVQQAVPPQRRDMDEDHRGRFNQMDDDPRNRFNRHHMEHEKERMMRRQGRQGLGLAGLSRTTGGPQLTPEQLKALQ